MLTSSGVGGVEDDGVAGTARRERSCGELDGLCSESHRAADPRCLLLGSRSITGRAVSDPISVDLARRADDVPRELETATCMPRQIRVGMRFSRPHGRRDLALQPREPRSRRGEEPSDGLGREPSPRYDMFLAVDPAHTDRAAVEQSRCSAPRGRRVRIWSFTYCRRSIPRARALVRCGASGRPLCESPEASRGELLADDGRGPPPGGRPDESTSRRRGTRQPAGSTSAKSAICRGCRRELLVGAADDHVGMDTDAAQLVDRVLCGFCVQLAGGLDERDERDVDGTSRSRADSRRNWRSASRNGSDSMSPTVPPISR